MTTNARNILELQEIDPDITDVSELTIELNRTIVELNFILRQLTLSNLDGDIKSLSIPAGGKVVVSHRLKAIPRHRVIIKQSGGGLITDGKFTSNYIELINSGVSVANITILIMKE